MGLDSFCGTRVDTQAADIVNKKKERISGYRDMHMCFDCEMEFKYTEEFIDHLEERRHGIWRITCCSSESQEAWRERFSSMMSSIAYGLLSAIASAKKERDNG